MPEHTLLGLSMLVDDLSWTAAGGWSPRPSRAISERACRPLLRRAEASRSTLRNQTMTAMTPAEAA